MTQTNSTLASTDVLAPWAKIEFNGNEVVEIQTHFTRDFDLREANWRVVAGSIRLADRPNSTEYSFTVTTTSGVTTFGVAEKTAIPAPYILAWADKTPSLPTPKDWLEFIRIDLASEFAAYMEKR